MTDEQIEWALKKYRDGKCTDVMNMDYGGVLDYIHRLKIRVQELGACNVRILEREANQIRKETSREILQELYDEIKQSVDIMEDYGNLYLIQRYAKKYGVEVK